MELMKSLRARQLRDALALLLAGVFTFAFFSSSDSSLAQGPPADKTVDTGEKCPIPPAKAIPSGLPHDFRRISDYFLLVDGKQVPSQIYQSDRPGAVLVISPALPSPVLLMADSVATVKPAAVEKKPDDLMILRPDAVLTPQGAFKYVDQEVKFSVAGHAAMLRDQPPLLGLRHTDEVTAHNPEYLSSAKAYPASRQEITALQKEGRPVIVRVYYGSWCSHCRKLVPHAVRVEQELKASKIRFEYFGVPTNFNSDPEIRKAAIQSIPTGVVYVNGTEAGRIVGDDAWKSPESTLRVILAATGTTGGGR